MYATRTINFQYKRIFDFALQLPFKCSSCQTDQYIALYILQNKHAFLFTLSGRDSLSQIFKSQFQIFICLFYFFLKMDLTNLLKK